MVLKINGLEEAQKQANIDARSIEDVTFSLTREYPGKLYRIYQWLEWRFYHSNDATTRQRIVEIPLRAEQDGDKGRNH